VSAIEFVEGPPAGRQTIRTRRVRLGDVTTSGRLRLDALARYLQDVATDDVLEEGLTGPWVLRRVALEVKQFPRYHDDVELTTFCSGIGPRVAERRTTVRIDGGIALEVLAIWVYVDARGRPAPIDPAFLGLYATSTEGRRVTGRLRHDPPPRSATSRSWPLRATDIDVLGHANNAVAWAAAEDALAEAATDADGRGAELADLGARIARAEMEYRAPLDPGEEPELRMVVRGDGLSSWLIVDDEVRTSTMLDLS
jgi:acyl-ACP thioesterase